MKDNPVIIQMTKEIVDICSPLQIFLVSHKNNLKGGLASFKLCVIVDDKYEDNSRLESDILLKTDCPVPCDIIIYSISEWNDCIEDDCTFAYRVDSAGVLLYEQGK